MANGSEKYDIAVIGGGHAGVEAALASARLGCKTLLLTLCLDDIANMPCNPSIGGTAKGHLVKEIDALGGEMGKAADACMLQSRMLNRGKGPAVHSLRVQTDRAQYHAYLKQTLENQENLYIQQDEMVDLSEKNHKVERIYTKQGAEIEVQAVILCCGTYLNGKIHMGDVHYAGGPDGSLASTLLTENLKKKGLPLRRFKTGTPARVHRRSIDFAKLEEQPGDREITPFSFETNYELTNRMMCYIAYTNQATHQVILDNLHRSPLYSGNIQGVGPRYCPSIEDKIVRFSDKPRHQLFLEPMGLNTEEVYLQGMSSSLPRDVQIKFLRTIQGLEHVEIMRSAYAIEYDCCDPVSLLPSLQFKSVEGLYGAGQFNGTSGYEEAAAQGLVAGINAARQVMGKPPIVLERSNSYIGTLIDDLVTKGCSDPYRMMTSRSEYRLLLRQDNADLRLTPLGYEIGLISDKRYESFLKKKESIQKEMERIEKVTIIPDEKLDQLFVSRETLPLKQPQRMKHVIRRPQICYKDLEEYDPTRPKLSKQVVEQVEISIKYEGYIQKQQSKVESMQKLENKKLPNGVDYSEIKGLRLEAQEKLNQIRPVNIGQASRISGVNPADIAVLTIWLKSKKENKNDCS